MNKYEVPWPKKTIELNGVEWLRQKKKTSDWKGCDREEKDKNLQWMKPLMKMGRES